MLSERDLVFDKLFRWAVALQILNTKALPFTCTPEVLVRLLSVEGVRDELKVSETTQGLPDELHSALRQFRKLNQKARVNKASRLLKTWKELSL